MGADVIVNTTRESLTEVVLRETDGLGADCAGGVGGGAMSAGQRELRAHQGMHHLGGLL